MFPVAWLVGAGLVGVLGVAAVVFNWDEVLEWLHVFLPKVADFVRSMTAQNSEFRAAGMMVGGFLDQVHAKIEHKLYHKIGNQKWLEETTRRTLPESELPPSIRQKIMQSRGDANITEDIEMMLGMAI